MIDPMHKEPKMKFKIPTVLAVAGTAISLVTPSANAGVLRHSTHTHAAKHVRILRVTRSKAVPADSSRVIVMPALPFSTTTTTAPTVVDDCSSSMTNCSPAELCSIWGANCQAPGSPDLAPAPAAGSKN